MPDTFTPEAMGLKLQRDYVCTPQYSVFEDEHELGIVKSILTAAKPRRRWPFLWITDDRAPREYVESFFERLGGPAARFYYTFPDFRSSPDAAPVLEAVAGGTQGARTPFVRFAWKNPAGTSRASPAGSILVPANNLLKVTLPRYPAGIPQAVIYASQGAAGTEVEQTVLTALETWTQPDAALLEGNPAPPTVNTARETLYCKIIAGTLALKRGTGITFTVAMELEEAY